MADIRYPKKWKEMALDLRLMFGYHISMMVMMAGGGALTVRHELAAAASIVALIVLVSRYHRQKRHWRWPGVKPINVLYAVGGMVLTSLFLYSATPLFPPNNSHIVPWYLAGFGLGLFNILQQLKVVYAAEADFVSNCMSIDSYGREVEPARDSHPAPLAEPNWNRITKVTYMVIFTLVWVCGVASFYFFGTAYKNGSPEPTATQTEPLENHGKAAYVTAVEKQRLHVLQVVSGVGVPVVLIAGLALHFLVGVKLIPNTPTLAEYLNRDKNRVPA